LNIVPSKRLQAIGGYAFAEVDKKVAELKARGITPIDFGVGDPTVPTPPLVRAACRKGIDARARSGYPSYIGAAGFRAACAAWMKRRFGVKLDPATEISSTIGSKEAVFNFAEAFVNPGDVVIIPTPGYPPYARGTQFAEGVPYYTPILAANGWLPDLGAIPAGIRKRAKLMWINYPNSPTGRIAPPAFFKQAIAFCRKHNIILASDEAYTEIWFKERPHSALEYGTEGVIAFYSLSKRSAMTGYRVGWVAGDRRVVDAFKKVKTNIDSGTPTFIQDAAVAALADEKHVRAFNAEYKLKRDILVKALVGAGLEDCAPEATLYIWQKVPAGFTDVSFATRLVGEDIAVVTTPGSWITTPVRGRNPGAEYVRFALVPSVADTRAAASRILKNLGKELAK
jgi:LL-diaminopimelate aminotransferase